MSTNAWKIYIQANGTTLAQFNEIDPAFRGDTQHKVILVSVPSTNNKRFTVKLANSSKTYATAMRKTGATETVEVSIGVFEEWEVWEGFLGNDLLNAVREFSSTPVFISFQDEEVIVSSNPGNYTYKGAYRSVPTNLTDFATDDYIGFGVNSDRKANQAYLFNGTIFEPQNSINQGTFAKRSDLEATTGGDNQIAFVTDSELSGSNERFWIWTFTQNSFGWVNTEKTELVSLTVEEFEGNRGIIQFMNIDNSALVQVAVNASNIGVTESVDVTETDTINDRLAAVETVASDLKQDSEDNPKVREALNYSIADGIDANILFYALQSDGKKVQVSGEQIFLFTSGGNNIGQFETGTALYEFDLDNGDYKPGQPDMNIYDGFYAGIVQVGVYNTIGLDGDPYTLETTIPNELVRWLPGINNWEATNTTYAEDTQDLRVDIDNNTLRLEDILNGTNLAGEGYDKVYAAIRDGVGNVINTTYETKADALAKESGLQAQIDQNKTDSEAADAVQDGRLGTLENTDVNHDTRITENKNKNDAQDGRLGAIEAELPNKENSANKTTNVRASGAADDIKYPTEKAVRDVVDVTGVTIKDRGTQIGNDRQFSKLNYVGGAILTPSGSDSTQINITPVSINGTGWNAHANSLVESINGVLVANNAPIPIVETDVVFEAGADSNDPNNLAIDGNPVSNNAILVQASDKGYATGANFLVSNTTTTPYNVTVRAYTSDIDDVGGVSSVLVSTDIQTIPAASDPGETISINFPFPELIQTTSANREVNFTIEASGTGLVVSKGFFVLESLFTNIENGGEDVENLMDKTTYDIDNSGVVDDAERLGGQLPADFAKTVDTGDNTNLNTTDKSNLVNAINEVKSQAVNNENNNSAQDTLIAANKIAVEDRLTIGNFNVRASRGVVPYKDGLGIPIFDVGGDIFRVEMLEEGFLPLIELIKSSDQTIVQGNTETIVFNTEKDNLQDPNNTQYQLSGNGVEELSTDTLSDYYIKAYIKYENANPNAVGAVGRLRLLRNGSPAGPFIDLPASPVDGSFVLPDNAADVTVAQGDVFTAEIEVFEDLDAPTFQVTVLATNAVGDALTTFGAYKTDTSLYTIRIKPEFIGDKPSYVRETFTEDINTPAYNVIYANQDMETIPGTLIENSVRNAYFANGLDKYIISFATSEIVNEKAVLTANGTQDLILIRSLLGANINQDDKYFCYARASLETGFDRFQFRFYDGGAGRDTLDLTSQVVNDQFVDYYGSRILTSAYIADSREFGIYVDNSSDIIQNGTKVTLDNTGIFAINMTKLGIQSYTDEQMLRFIKIMSDKKALFQGVNNFKASSYGKNLLNPETLVQDKYWSSAGDQIVSSSPVDNTFLFEQFIPYKTNTTIAHNNNNSSIQVTRYDANKNFIERTNVSVGNTLTITDENVKFIRFSFFNSPRTPQDAMVFYGEASNANEPYIPYAYDEVSVSLPEDLYSIGNVSDKLSYNDGNTFTKFKNFDRDTTFIKSDGVTWSTDGANNINNTRAFNGTGLEEALGYFRPASSSTTALIALRIGERIFPRKPVTTIVSTEPSAAVGISGSTGQLWIRIEQTDADSVEELETLLRSSDVEFIYQIEEEQRVDNYGFITSTNGDLNYNNDSIINIEGAVESIEFREAIDVAAQAANLVDGLQELSDQVNAQKEEKIRDIKFSDLFKFRETANGNKFLDGSFANIERMIGQTITQELVNGNFSNGSTNWQPTASTIIVGTDSVSFTGTGTGVTTVIDNETPWKSAATGDKLFMYCKIRDISGLSTELNIRCNQNGDFDVTQANPVQNQWYELYDTFTCNAPVDDIRIFSRFATAGDADGARIDIDRKVGIFAINMTQNNIEGHSTKEMLEIVRNGYWEGTKSVGESNGEQFVDNNYLNWNVKEFTTEIIDGVEYQVYTSDNANFIDGNVDTNLKDNTKYTVLYEVLENTQVNESFQLVSSSANYEQIEGNITININELGIFKKSLTTGTIGNNRAQSFMRPGEVLGGQVKVRFIIVSGDLTHISDEYAKTLIRTLDVGVYTLEDISITSLGRNLFDEYSILYDPDVSLARVSKTELDGNRVTITSSDADSYRGLSHTGGFANADQRSLYIPVEPGKTYKYSRRIEGLTAGSTNEFYFCSDRAFFTIGAAWYASIGRSVNGVSENLITIPEGAYHIGFRYGATVAGQTVTYSDFMLQEVEDATDYKPYEKSTTHIPYALRSVGTVKDEIKDGLLIQRVDEDFNDVVQSATSWSELALGLTNVIIFRKDLTSELGYKPTDNNTIVANTKLKIENTIFPTFAGSGASSRDFEWTAIDGDLLVIAIERNKLTTEDSAGFEAYLQSNDVQFIYELDDYQNIDLELTDTSYKVWNGGQEQINSAIKPLTTISYSVDSFKQVEHLSKANDELEKEVQDLRSRVTSLGNTVEDDKAELEVVKGSGWDGQTVKQNREAIDSTRGVGWSNETVKDNADDINDLAGTGRTTETVKDNADDIDALDVRVTALEGATGVITGSFSGSSGTLIPAATLAGLAVGIWKFTMKATQSPDVFTIDQTSATFSKVDWDGAVTSSSNMTLFMLGQFTTNPTLFQELIIVRTASGVKYKIDGVYNTSFSGVRTYGGSGSTSNDLTFSSQIGITDGTYRIEPVSLKDDI